MRRVLALSCGVPALTLLIQMGACPIAAQDDVDRGKRTFSEAGCVMCHGPSARGGDGPSLVPMARDFPDFIRVVREGIGEMPGQAEEEVTDEQIERVYEFIVRLSQPSGER